VIGNHHAGLREQFHLLGQTHLVGIHDLEIKSRKDVPEIREVQEQSLSPWASVQEYPTSRGPRRRGVEHLQGVLEVRLLERHRHRNDQPLDLEHGCVLHPIALSQPPAGDRLSKEGLAPHPRPDQQGNVLRKIELIDEPKFAEEIVKEVPVVAFANTA